MRATIDGTALKLSAYAGSYVVVLAWDTIDGKKPSAQDLLGYAIERTELDGEGHPVERYWLRGLKRFKGKDNGLPPGTPVSTADHPVQGFQWADYTVHSGTRYRYRVVPTCGTPKHLVLDDAQAATVEVLTEMEGDMPEEGKTRHDVFFNRGVIGSQAYAREFGNRTPDENDPASPEMKWLSRGLFEALLRFIGLAKDGFGLRAAVYEFHYQPVVNAFARAVEAGADVKIIYDAEDAYKADNQAAIAAAGLDAAGAAIPRTVTEGIRHNKFIVLLHGEEPVAVWTGSTNISAGGIFGHSNVGHIAWDPAIAREYLEYWKRLEKNPTPTKLAKPNRTANPTPAAKIDEHSTYALFSPRDAKDSVETLQWYADRMGEAKEVACLTVAFNLDEVFQQVVARENDVLRYLVKDDPLAEGETIGHDRDVLFAAGGFLEEGALANFLRERSNPLNRNRYIHTKFMLVDPLSDDPLVVMGSANFSRPSQRVNDENMLAIRGDTRVADIYFGEYMRIFDHHYARYIVKLLKDEGRSDPEAGYLKAKASEWVPSHFDAKSYKSKRRRYFARPAGATFAAAASHSRRGSSPYPRKKATALPST
jgi:phosphatidylserine/phosphatidylglycerophosphate/cardiolipin synthase-like enzyme